MSSDVDRSMFSDAGWKLHQYLDSIGAFGLTTYSSCLWSKWARENWLRGERWPGWERLTEADTAPAFAYMQKMMTSSELNDAFLALRLDHNE